MLLKLAKFFFFVALLNVVVVLPATSAPYAGEYYFFRTAVELSSASLALWWGFAASPDALNSRVSAMAADPLFRAVTVFVLAFLAACIFAYDAHAAFWSSYTRGDGGFQMLHNYAFFVLAFLLLKTEQDWRRALKVVVVVACLSIAYGLLAAALPLSFLGYLSPDGKPVAASFAARLFSDMRFTGSLGNAAYLATALLFAMAFSLYLAFTSLPKPGREKTFLYAILILVLLTFFLMTQTRGALLGLMAAIAAFVAFLAVSDARYRKRAAVTIVVLVTLSAAALSSRQLMARFDVPEVRLLEMSMSEANARARFWAWHAAWDGFRERPLLGWGPENFEVVFDRNFDSRFFVPGGGKVTWYDRAHSAVFDYLAETGLFGLAAYIAIFVVFYQQLLRYVRRTHNVRAQRSSAMSTALLFAVPIAFLVQASLFFDVLPSYVNLFLFLALSARCFRLAR